MAEEHRLAELKAAVSRQLSTLGLADEVHAALVELQRDGTVISADRVLELLRARGTVDRLTKAVAPAPVLADEGPMVEEASTSGRRVGGGGG